MIFEQIRIGGDRNFAYLIGDPKTRAAAVVDPAYSQDEVLRRIEDYELNLIYIINTHSHHDHIGGNEVMKRCTGAPVIAHESMSPAIADQFVKDGARLPLGSLTLEFIHTPGHSNDSMCILVGDKLITGDTLFVGKIGGTGSRAAAEAQYQSLHETIMKLPESTEIYPGHDVGTRPVSTIGDEKRNNPFIVQKSFEDFLHLKEHWSEYKTKHGIR